MLRNQPVGGLYSSLAGHGDSMGDEKVSGARVAPTWAMAGSLFYCQLRTVCEAVLLSTVLGVQSLTPWGKEKRKNKERVADNGKKDDEEYSLYEGVVWHERKHPVRHQFDYKVRYALVNMDKVPSWFAASSSRHHMTAEQARSAAGTTGPVHLLCMPASVGYEQNPLSVYYCYDSAGENLVKAIAEVTNTPWGERVTFEFDVANDKVAKPLHVSPFMDMAGSWLMTAPTPGDKLAMTIGVDHPELGNIFLATLRAKKVSFVQSPENFFWLMPHKVAVGIYWQALLLLWKRVAFVQHPKYIDGDAYKNRSLARNEALSKARSACCSCSPSLSSEDDELRLQFGPENNSSFGVVKDGPSSNRKAAQPQRFCKWRDAAGPPWS